MATKVQSQLLVNELTRDRADALAIVRNEARAEIYRLALEGGGLRQMEKDHSAELAALDQVATGFNLSRRDLVQRMVADGLKLTDVVGKRRYPVKRTG